MFYFVDDNEAITTDKLQSIIRKNIYNKSYVFVKCVNKNKYYRYQKSLVCSLFLLFGHPNNVNKHKIKNNESDHTGNQEIPYIKLIMYTYVTKW